MAATSFMHAFTVSCISKHHYQMGYKQIPTNQTFISLDVMDKLFDYSTEHLRKQNNSRIQT